MTQAQRTSTQGMSVPLVAKANSLITQHIIKVAATSRTNAVAGAIAGVIRQKHEVKVQAIGAGAVNQAIKAITVAIGYLNEENIHVVCVPYFVPITIDDEELTAIRIQVEQRT